MDFGALGASGRRAYDLVACPLYSSAPVWGTALLATVLAVFIPVSRLYRQNVHNALRGV